MSQAFSKTIICSLGGSVIAPEEGIDIELLTRFKEFVLSEIAQQKQIFLVCGGGVTCRHYQIALRHIVDGVTDEALDQMGVQATRLNAHFVRTIFADKAYPEVVIDYSALDSAVFDYPIVVGGGWKTGASSDFNAVALAQKLGQKTLINLSNIAGVYDKDPNEFSDAVLLEHIRWDEVLRIVGTVWRPGLNRPFDPVAAQKAKDIGLKVITCDGRDLENLKHVFADEPFVGTVIE